MTDYQSKIAEAVRGRGYREGWTDEQFAARQVAKLVEEVGELARSVSFGLLLGSRVCLMPHNWHANNSTKKMAGYLHG